MAHDIIPTKDRRDYYVYVLFRADGSPFYVGKGRGVRWQEHEKRRAIHPHKARTIAKVMGLLGEIPKVKVAEDLEEHAAFRMEIALIAAIGRHPNGPLINRTDGGEGVSNIPADSAAMRSAKQKAAWRLTEPRKAHAAVLGGMHRGKKQSAEHIAKKNASATGKKRSEETKAKMRAYKTGTTQSAETCAKRAATWERKREEARQAGRKVGKPRLVTDEERALRSRIWHASEASKAHLAAMSAANKGRIITPEHRANLSAAHRRRRDKLAREDHD